MMNRQRMMSLTLHEHVRYERKYSVRLLAANVTQLTRHHSGLFISVSQR